MPEASLVTSRKLLTILVSVLSLKTRGLGYRICRFLPVTHVYVCMHMFAEISFVVLTAH